MKFYEMLNKQFHDKQPGTLYKVIIFMGFIKNFSIFSVFNK